MDELVADLSSEEQAALLAQALVILQMQKTSSEDRFLCSVIKRVALLSALILSAVFLCIVIKAACYSFCSDTKFFNEIAKSFDWSDPQGEGCAVYEFLQNRFTAGETDVIQTPYGAGFHLDWPVRYVKGTRVPVYQKNDGGFYVIPKDQR
jgi:hypothetical protein